MKAKTQTTANATANATTTTTANVLSTKILRANKNRAMQAPNGKYITLVDYMPAYAVLDENGAKTNTREQAKYFVQEQGQEVQSYTAKQLNEKYGIETSGAGGGGTRRTPAELFSDGIKLLQQAGILQQAVEKIEAVFNNLKAVQEVEQEVEQYRNLVLSLKSFNLPTDEAVKRLIEAEKRLDELQK